LFFQPGLIYTKIKDEPPTTYFDSANVANSLIANGCRIEGSVENSILFRGVKVHEGVRLRNCIVLQNCEIKDNVTIENAILDKEVMVTANKMLCGDQKVPYIAQKRKVI
jgi:glucose-1-phosphate adenylyltransferase